MAAALGVNRVLAFVVCERFRAVKLGLLHWLLPALGALLLTACADRAADPDRAGGPAPGLAMAVELPPALLPDLAGKERPLRLVADEATVINFWATWCLPCLKELPELEALHSKWRDRNVHVVGIIVDSGNTAGIVDFMKRHEMTYDVRHTDSTWIVEQFAVFGLPETVIADRAGVMRRRLIGPHDLAQFEAALQAAVDHHVTGSATTHAQN